MNNKNVYIVIMAGGEGIRFAPASTPDKPKQFMSFWGKRTFIQKTFDRISEFVPSSNIYISTNKKYLDLVSKQLPQIPGENIISESEKKNTAPSIAYSANLINKCDRDSIMAILPSDHVISNVDNYMITLNNCIITARQYDSLVTIGIKPTWPAESYGYIKAGNLKDEKLNAYTVARFAEKPSGETAKEYLADGSYYWNSGMFVWKSAVILQEIEKYLPSLGKLLKYYSDKSDIKNFFHEAKAISIDYGVMERSDKVMMIPCEMGWSDIGTWEGLKRFVEANGVQLNPEIEKIMRAKT